MEELSIEEKAKRYDEAIEKLRNFYRDYDTVSRLIDVKEELANLIPELKESEDWIPKEIIKYLKEKGGFRSCWIAWLEKQGEQNLANSAKTCKVEHKFNPCDGCVNRRGCINCENGELRETEQKSTAWSEEDEAGLSDALWCCKQAASIAKNEEKDLELTVEDIVHIIETYNELEFSREFTTVTFNDTCKEVLKRFKDYKERKDGSKG